MNLDPRLASAGPRTVQSEDISASRGLARWLASNRLSFACTSYQTGRLMLVGSHEDGAVAVNQCGFDRAMGLCWRPGRLYVATKSAVWRLENILRPGERANGVHDVVLTPRNAQLTGDLDVHEIGVDAQGRSTFVNTSFSCLATTDPVHSFRPVWKPPFITRLAPEDRCHLNGVAFGIDGAPAYVSAAGVSDIVGGWREHRGDGGVLIDVRTDMIVAEGLSMPHSPRVVGDEIFFLDSGRGWIVRLDPISGERRDVAFCPGFLRGLAIHNGHALVTVSEPREAGFKGLPLEGNLEARGAIAWCGVLVVQLSTGDIVEWMRFNGAVTEVFDVVALPGVRCPMVIAPDSAEAQQTITFIDGSDHVSAVR